MYSLKFWDETWILSEHSCFFPVQTNENICFAQPVFLSLPRTER